MASASGERVEFVDARLDPEFPVGADAIDGLALGGPARPRGPRRALVAALVMVVGAGLLARQVAHQDPPAPAVAAPQVDGGQVSLGEPFGAPISLVTTTTPGDADVVWVLGNTGLIERIEDGRPTAVSATAGFTMLAVRPDGRGVFAATEQDSPQVVALDPVTLVVTSRVLAAAPVRALTAGVGSVWAASAVGVQGWTTDLTRELRTLAVPSAVAWVRSITVVGAQLVAVVVTSPGSTAVLRLAPAGGAPTLTSSYPDPVSVVPGDPTFVAHLDPSGTMLVARDGPPSAGDRPIAGPLRADASIWPVGQSGTAVWLAAAADLNSFDCYDASGVLVGRMAAGDGVRGFQGPVVTTARAVYAITVDGRLARGGLGSCGVHGRA